MNRRCFDLGNPLATVSRRSGSSLGVSVKKKSVVNIQIYIYTLRKYESWAVEGLNLDVATVFDSLPSAVWHSLPPSFPFSFSLFVPVRIPEKVSIKFHNK